MDAASFSQPPFPNGRRYHSYADHFRQRYGQRMQKLSIDAGFSCPNREADRQKGGCTFCNNSAFNPSYCSPAKSITQQLDEGISFHEHRYRKAGRYLAYFQAYSNTYAPLPVLRERYSEALSHERVGGLIVGTRPDCVDDGVLELLEELRETYDNPYIAVEYGIESCYDDTLQRVRRGHDFATTRSAIERTAAHGIACGGHLILGLPGENRKRMLEEASLINTLPLNSLKLHQLQILKGSEMAGQMNEAVEEEEGWGLRRGFALEEYIALVCDFLERLRPDIMLERFAGEVPPRFQACPERSWRRPDGRLLRNEEIPVLVERELERRNSWQGMRLSTN